MYVVILLENGFRKSYSHNLLMLPSVYDLGSAWSFEQCIPPDLQHGLKSSESGRNQSRVHAWKILLPVPELCLHSRIAWEYEPFIRLL